MLPFSLLVASSILLSVFAGGVLPGVLYNATFFSCAALLIVSGCRRYRSRFCLPSRFCFVIVVWILATAAPLPDSITNRFGTLRVQQQERVRTALRAAADLNFTDVADRNFSLSRNRSGTLRTVLFVFSVFAITGLATCLPREWAYRYLRFLAGFAAVIAALGFIGQHVVPQGKFIWWHFPVSQGDPVGCFVNRSHFGGFLVMLCPAVLLMIVRDINGRNRKLTIFGILCFAIISIGIMGSMSRGAFVLFALCLIATVICTIPGGNATTGITISVLACMSLFAGSLLITGKVEHRLRTLRRPVEDVGSQPRIAVWRDSVRTWLDYPVVGAGADGFQMVHAMHKSHLRDRTVRHAESRCLQLLVDGGIVGVIMVFGLIVGYLRRLRRMISGRPMRTIEKIAVLTLGCAAVHAMIDVPLFIPLYASVLGSIAGLPLNRLAEQTTESEKGQSLSTRLASVGRREMRTFGILGMVVGLIILLQYGSRVHQTDRSAFIVHAGPDDLADALTSAPTSWQAWYHLGRYGFLVDDPSANAFGERCISQAAMYNPTDYKLWGSLVQIRRSLGDLEGAEEALRHKQNTTPEDVRKKTEKYYKLRNKELR